MLAGALALAMWQAAETMMPTTVGLVIGRAIERRDETALWWGLAAVGLVTLTTTIGFRYGDRFLTKAVVDGIRDVQGAVARRVVRSDGMVLGPELTTGDVYRAGTADAEATAKVLELVGAGFAVLVALVAPAVVLLVISPLLGVIIIVSVPPLMLGLHLAGKVLQRHEAEHAAASARAVSVATDLVTGMRVIKGLRARPAAMARYAVASDAARDARVRLAWTTGGFQGAVALSTGVLTTLVVLVGGKFALDGRIGLGELVAVVGVSRLFVNSFHWAGSLLAMVASVRAGATRVAAVIGAPAAIAPVPPGAGAAIGAAGGPGATLVVDAVTIEGAAPMSFHVAPGEVVGLVLPPSAAGRLTAVLARERDAPAGTIALGSTDATRQPVDELPADTVREAMLVAAHETTLFEGTLRDNITIGGDDAAALALALRASGADEVAASLPDGLDGQVTARGRSLSGGQRQRVVLARAIAARPPILVLQEPTTAIDAATEAAVARGLVAARRDDATLLITTSPALLATTDRVVWATTSGTVVGSHAELLADDEYAATVLA